MKSSPTLSAPQLWQRYLDTLVVVPELGMTLDVSRMRFTEEWIERMRPEMERALGAMEELERGAIANPDENRRVGHYWLRAPDLAPEPEIRDAITKTVEEVVAFVSRVHSGGVTAPAGGPFKHFLVVGIGGSALGPLLVCDALRRHDDPMRAWFCDNTDPDGIELTLGEIGEDLGRTLVIVVSKSGGTKETRNGALEVRAEFERRGIEFARAAVAVTGEGSELDRQAREEDWLAIFPMWDWVGGRTSVTSAVGLLPAALQGIDVDAFLEGARVMDEATRRREVRENPAAMMALMWHWAGGGRGEKDLVTLPYKDRLLLLSRHLQQLVMESLGKEKDLEGRVVHQGLTVYGNKGSTDQHAFVQQLRDGPNNFFVTFIEVLEDRFGPELEVEPGVTSGDYLMGFLLGTRQALYEGGRESMTLTVPEVSPRTMGALIALFERTVGFYASLININAYHQPGVEAGKKAAQAVIELQARVMQVLHANSGMPRTAEEIAENAGGMENVEAIYKILEHLAANPARRVKRVGEDSPREAKFSIRS